MNSMSLSGFFKKAVDRVAKAVPKVSVNTDKNGLTVTVSVPGAAISHGASFTSDGEEISVKVDNSTIDDPGEKGYIHTASVSSPLGTVKGGFSVSVATNDQACGCDDASKASGN